MTLKSFRFWKRVNSSAGMGRRFHHCHPFKTANLALLSSCGQPPGYPGWPQPIDTSSPVLSDYPLFAYFSLPHSFSSPLPPPFRLCLPSQSLIMKGEVSVGFVSIYFLQHHGWFCGALLDEKKLFFKSLFQHARSLQTLLCWLAGNIERMVVIGSRQGGVCMMRRYSRTCSCILHI